MRLGACGPVVRGCAADVGCVVCRCAEHVVEWCAAVVEAVQCVGVWVVEGSE